MLVDADLQDPPELLGQMMELMDQGADVVFGQRRSRSGENWFKLASAAAFYRLLARMTDVPIPKDTGDFRLMNRRVVEILVAMPERARFIRGMVTWIGGRQVPLLYDRAARNEGKTKYSLLKMIALASDAVTSFSVAPLRLAFALGLFVAVVAALLFAYALFEWIFGRPMPGWTSIIVVICFFAGTQLLVLGIIGEYVGRLLNETKARPLYVIDSVLASGQVCSVPIEFSSLSPTERQRILRTLGDNVGWHRAEHSPTPAAWGSSL
jgi:dolichol-phosphate mannosyltransferase